MGPSNLVLVFACFIALPTFLTFLSLLYSHPPKGQLATESTGIGNGRLLAFFAFRAPSSLFPSSAIISLTDDNSTFFLSRPADFGPKLASDGSSGQLWIGTGFGDSSMKSGPTTLGAEGELGCSDVPGWGENDGQYHGNSALQKMYIDPRGEIHENGFSSSSRMGRTEPQHEKEDGTDDHLHVSRPDSTVSKSLELGRTGQEKSSKGRHSFPHADIRSLQESAEIAGKIVLLSRGGCGFLEKVMWAQRRGAAALIVGDDTPGGPLITMFARGDTSNVTIPSLFTSHTTAHLLATLIPPDRPMRNSGSQDLPKSGKSDERAGSLLRGNPDSEAKKSKNDQAIWNRAVKSPTSTNSAHTRLVNPESTLQRAERQNDSGKAQDLAWLHVILSRIGLEKRSHTSDLPADSRRPPNSGRFKWIDGKLNDDAPKAQINNINQASAVPNDVAGRSSHSTASRRGPVDNFIIGVQDWRDKDLVAQISSSDDSPARETTATKPKSLLSKPATSVGDKPNGIGGDIITPGSGEYESTGRDPKLKHTSQDADLGRGVSTGAGGSQAWLSQMLYREEAEDSIPRERSSDASSSGVAIQQTTQGSHQMKNQNVQGQQAKHEGLWVTLTPSTMSTSPFLDTLLVLVVSPLITLTVVYALLLLRSRIRRRRWRAPKSVVGRLPVRTYHTMSCSSTSSPRAATPPDSSPTSPLFQTPSPSALTCPRPRSRATSTIGRSVPTVADHVTPDVSLQQSENQARPSAGKRKYAGKQVECVVCLEEYVDGHSRVMSLPCGHEFHAECMYVWYRHN